MLSEYLNLLALLAIGLELVMMVYVFLLRAEATNRLFAVFMLALAVSGIGGLLLSSASTLPLAVFSAAVQAMASLAAGPLLWMMTLVIYLPASPRRRWLLAGLLALTVLPPLLIAIDLLAGTRFVFAFAPSLFTGGYVSMREYLVGWFGPFFYWLDVVILDIAILLPLLGFALYPRTPASLRRYAWVLIVAVLLAGLVGGLSRSMPFLASVSGPFFLAAAYTWIISRYQPSENRSFGFWGRLPLSRKLLVAFGVSFIFALVIALVTLRGLNQVTTAYEDTLTQGVQIRTLSDRLTISLLQSRNDGKDFLLRWRTEGYDKAYAHYVTYYKGDVIAMRGYIQQLASFGPETGVPEPQYAADIAPLAQDIASVTQATDTYETSFLALVAAAQVRGSDVNTGLEGQMGAAAQNIDVKISGVAGLEQLDSTYDTMRRAEKDYINRKDQTYSDEVHTLVAQLKTQISGTDQLDPATKTDLLTQADNYLAAFHEIVVADQEIATHDTELTNAALTLQTSVAKINALGEKLAVDDTKTAHTGSSQTFTISIITVLVVLAVSILLAAILSRQITKPVIQLTNTAQQISAGNFDAQAEVTSTDEVGTLAQTFNNMTSRLRQAFEDVRRRALAVQTSAVVSRRLSVATNPRQLAVDVVEQVQSAFNYYHAHIYFVDEASGDLILAGGTGEAGATMLARGHKVPKGGGLVGRAAATNEPVLVPDVSQAEGWLPNPLLPDTKSEAAIPISVGNQVLGVLDVQQNVVNGLGEEDVSLLQSLAGQVAISLQNARSYEQAKAQADLESMVNAIGQKIQRTTTVDDTLQTAIREIGLALGASRVSANIAGRQDDGNSTSQD